MSRFEKEIVHQYLFPLLKNDLFKINQNILAWNEENPQPIVLVKVPAKAPVKGNSVFQKLKEMFFAEKNKEYEKEKTTKKKKRNDQTYSNVRQNPYEKSQMQSVNQGHTKEIYPRTTENESSNEASTSSIYPNSNISPSSQYESLAQNKQDSNANSSKMNFSASSNVDSATEDKTPNSAQADVYVPIPQKQEASLINMKRKSIFKTQATNDNESLLKKDNRLQKPGLVQTKKSTISQISQKR